MNTVKNTKCPLCGAPVVVHITDELTRVSYEYTEPPSPPAPTIHGYNVEYLKMVAELMIAHGVTPEDLHELKANFQRASDILRAEQERIRRAAIDQMMQGFNPDTFPVLKLEV